MQVRPSTAADDAARDRFVEAHPKGTVFHLAGWRRAVRRVFRHEERDLLAFRGKELVGVLPLMRCRTPFLASHLVSVPYGVYGGPIGVDRAVEHALIADARRLARELGVGRLELRCFEDPGVAELAPSTLYSAFLQTVPDDPKDVMAQMPKRARAEARKAIEKHGLELSEGDWYLGDLVELFGAAKQGLGSPGLPRAWFQALMEELPGKVVLHLARKGDLRLAATMSFVSNGVFSFYYIGNTPEANREFSATNFLTVKLQEWCAARGVKTFDLGRSRLDTGPYQFKKNQGFEPTPLAYRYDLVKSKELPSFNPSNPRTEKLRNTWAKLPPSVARMLSGRLMRYLP
ncbi:MAG: GNAT family N-acetyltransferase [Planctomycetes bacterium]|nr:GNAT family N-acetyltransferase [Planctomycetota bacterium]